ncbi:hypothetical protein AUEXF2481DRAFT_477345 [Aureobasidium subglaciale EXF-2481]|uniref:Uncharacterized protein n=1 Tax=Aureobasidium subglaciale (strain EXF-2481) TaxID=1043005 RepID=A0A074YQ44_AURSE|nr:uncharacterized protein AUEXF2481DRAFT_477345 [Aureobasidium subglaciale EXF-2481]KEQ98279.1 hypothetical protein AUEXF2481DRAFT_477345 [Aureobasidium subglaciale EXF-2481]
MYLHQGATLVIWLSCTWQHSNQRRIRLVTTYLGTGCNHKSRRESNLIYRLASYCNRLPLSGGTLSSVCVLTSVTSISRSRHDESGKASLSADVSP